MDRLQISSYRPINNLPTVEKIVEAHILANLETFFDKNKIFLHNHHGGRKHHSTVTAISKIYDILYRNDEKSVISIILTTDLSACYDTIDIPILLKKLEYYGIRGDWLSLFESYYTDWITHRQ